LGTRESVWPIRSRHEYAIGIAVIEMAPGDTTVGSTPYTRVLLMEVREDALADHHFSDPQRNNQPRTATAQR
jgi:hypothetical protein